MENVLLRSSKHSSVFCLCLTCVCSLSLSLFVVSLFPSLSSSPPYPDRRYMILGEIIDTERKYIRSLEVLLNGYLPALEHVVAPRDLRLLFPAQLEPIMEKHRDLLTQLEGRVSADSLYPDIVGDIFARLCGTDVSPHNKIITLC